jgi:hypothetical protein
MDEKVRKELESLEAALLAAPVRSVFNSAIWADDDPAAPGVYALWDVESGQVIYVGETRSLRERMADLGRTVNHTCRRTIVRLLELDGQDEAAISLAMSKRYFLSFISVDLGRAELEDYLTLRWHETILNQRGSRLRRVSTYNWVQPTQPKMKMRESLMSEKGPADRPLTMMCNLNSSL